VCHQSVSLIARHLEENGIPTVVMGCAKDIVESAGIARFWFSNFPLGHSAGKPLDPQSQQQTLQGALSMFDSATAPRTTHLSPQSWTQDNTWKDDFMSIAHLDAVALEKLKRSHEAVRATSKKKRS